MPTDPRDLPEVQEARERISDFRTASFEGDPEVMAASLEELSLAAAAAARAIRPPLEDAVPLEADRLLKMSEATERLRVNAKTLGRWGKQGKMRIVRTAGGHRRFFESDIQRILEGKQPIPPGNRPTDDSTD